MTVAVVDLLLEDVHRPKKKVAGAASRTTSCY